MRFSVPLMLCVTQPKFDDLLDRIRNYQKDGRTKLKASLQNQEDNLLQTTLDAKIKIAENQEDEMREANMRVRKQKTILVEEQVFCEKLRLGV